MNRVQFESQRRRAFRTVAVMLIVGVAVWTTIYLTSSEQMRPLYLVLGSILLGLSVASAIALVVVYNQVSKKIGKDETAPPP